MKLSLDTVAVVDTITDLQIEIQAIHQALTQVGVLPETIDLLKADIGRNRKKIRDVVGGRIFARQTAP